VNEKRVTDRQTDRQISQKRSISPTEIYLKIIMCRMGSWSFWSSSDANRSVFHEDIREKRFFCIFVPSDLDLWPFDLKLFSFPS